VGGHPNSRGVVAAASYEARPYGLKAGMPLTTAYRLCPQAVYLPGSYHLYEAFSKRFMDILADFTPDLEPMGIDEAFIDLTGFEPFYGPVECAAAVIKARIREELGITASVGIAACKVVATDGSDPWAGGGFPGSPTRPPAPLRGAENGAVSEEYRCANHRPVGPTAPGYSERHVWSLWGCHVSLV
ncbi:MAG: dinB, partial [Dehalococcoidia bacterium]|nr:dinB [Dehalococcoidia bacterium]